MNGRLMPLAGSAPVTTPTFRMACRPTVSMMPAARRKPKRSEARWTMRLARQMKTAKRPMTRRPPMMPISSQITAKMKSVVFSGMYSFWVPAPNPAPKVRPTRSP